MIEPSQRPDDSGQPGVPCCYRCLNGRHLGWVHQDCECPCARGLAAGLISEQKRSDDLATALTSGPHWWRSRRYYQRAVAAEARLAAVEALCDDYAARGVFNGVVFDIRAALRGRS